MPNRLAQALHSAFHAGAGGSPDPRRAKRIILSNQISLSIALLSLPFIVIYAGSGAGHLGWLEIPVLLGYASVHRLNRAGRTGFARLFLITLANLDILVYSLSLGTASGQHLFFLLAGWTPLVIFDWEERRSIAYGIGLSSALLLAAEAFIPASGLGNPLPAADSQRIRLIEIAAMQIVQLLLIAYFFRGNRRTEMALGLAMESARHADAAKGRFLAGMGGAVRAPIALILDHSRQLMDSSPDPKSRETLEDIRLSARDLLGIVDGLLDLSRLEAGMMRLEPAPFSPLRLGHQVLRPFEIEAARKGLELSFEADPGLPALLLGDAARLKQVLRNLVGNACKFTEAGKVVLRMRYGPAEEPAAMGKGSQGEGTSGGQSPSLVCEVEDTGIGIADNARGTLFEPFAQGDASMARKHGGTGLGLFISKQIVELMDGTIGYAPASAGGSVFRFHAPMPVCPEPAVTGPAEEGDGAGFREGPETGRGSGSRTGPSAQSAGPGMETVRDGGNGNSLSAPGATGEAPGGLRALVVDDHPMNRKLLLQFLAGYGISADAAASAEEALEACASGAYGVVFLDCHMPGMDGFTCARRMRMMRFPGPRQVLIGVTADSADSVLRRCLEAGMDGFLAKPILDGKLREVLEDCAGWRKRAALER